MTPPEAAGSEGAGSSRGRLEIALLVSGASGSMLAARFARAALTAARVDALHLAGQVLSHELGPEGASARGFCEQHELPEPQRARLHPWADSDLAAPIASGSHLLAGVVVLPCSAGMAGALANGISRGLVQRVADVALKQRWPLLLGVRETPLSPILLDNLLRLARAGAHIVPPIPAFYLNPDEGTAMTAFADHYCMRLFDLLGLPSMDEGLRWKG